MEYKIVFDTNIWISYVNLLDINHDKAIKIIEENSEDKIIIPDFILQETINVLKLKIGLEISKSFYENIISNPNSEVLITNLHSDEYYQEFLANDNRKLSFVDSALLHLHKSKYFKVITLDKNLSEKLDKIKVKKRN